MDTRYLVEKGGYKREELRKEQEEFVAGIEWAKDHALEGLATDYELTLDREDSSILEKMQAEERLAAIDLNDGANLEHRSTFRRLLLRRRGKI